jgi:F-type H+-transporting ATPase subunit c
MDFQTALAFALPLGVGIAAVGSGLGLGRAVGSAMEAMGRQPEAAGKIQLGMIIGCALIEALTIYALVTMFVFQGKVGS